MRTRARTVTGSIRTDETAGRLGASLSIPRSPCGLIVFAHGSGSSRLSPRNQFVADRLARSGFATLLTDLLTQDEERVDRMTAEFRFDVTLLARRLAAATDHARAAFADAPLPIGYFGASTGAAAALIAAAQRPEEIFAVVSRGGRPDLAAEALAAVKAPTLLIVGSSDTTVLALNRQAQQRMRCRCELALIPGASHLFEEPGALERVAEMAAQWFETAVQEL
jgi:putative phosphoribosyl transferase